MILGIGDQTRGRARRHRYYSSGRSLYHVEQRLGGHVVVEDCSTGDLIAVTVADLERMIPVEESNGAGRSRAVAADGR